MCCLSNDALNHLFTQFVCPLSALLLSIYFNQRGHPLVALWTHPADGLTNWANARCDDVLADFVHTLDDSSSVSRGFRLEQRSLPVVALGKGS